MSKENTKATFPGTRPDADGVVRCEICDGPIDTEEWYPIATEWEGDLSIYKFCSRDCCDLWDDS